MVSPDFSTKNRSTPGCWPASVNPASGPSTNMAVESASACVAVGARTETLATSVSKTGRCLIAHEATGFAGFGAELSASIQEHCFWDLEAPIVRVAGWDTPYPHAFEWDYFPGKTRVRLALEKLMAAA